MIYEANCAACHGVNGEGVIGPNLTDEQWIYGSSGLEIYHSIMDGRQNNQMPAWGPILGERKVSLVAAYVLSMKDNSQKSKN